MSRSLLFAILIVVLGISSYLGYQAKRQAEQDAAMAKFRAPVEESEKKPSMKGNYNADKVGF